MGKTTTVIWDWNGTLLDDAPVCVADVYKRQVRVGVLLAQVLKELREGLRHILVQELDGHLVAAGRLVSSL